MWDVVVVQVGTRSPQEYKGQLCSLCSQHFLLKDFRSSMDDKFSSDTKGSIEDRMAGSIHRLTLAEAKDSDKSNRLSDEKFEKEGVGESYMNPSLLSGNNGLIGCSASAREIALGLRIVEMRMRDVNKATDIWHSEVFNEQDEDSLSYSRASPCFRAGEISERVPKEILSCRTICREIRFSSVREVSHFRLHQRVYLHGNCLEEWNFEFGFVMPGSTNTWQQIIDAAPAEKMIPAEVLSGNVTFETCFFNGDEFLCKNVVRLYYT